MHFQGHGFWLAATIFPIKSIKMKLVLDMTDNFTTILNFCCHWISGVIVGKINQNYKRKNLIVQKNYINDFFKQFLGTSYCQKIWWAWFLNHIWCPRRNGDQLVFSNHVDGCIIWYIVRSRISYYFDVRYPKTTKNAISSIPPI